MDWGDLIERSHELRVEAELGPVGKVGVSSTSTVSGRIGLGARAREIPELDLELDGLEDVTKKRLDAGAGSDTMSRGVPPAAVRLFSEYGIRVEKLWTDLKGVALTDVAASSIDDGMERSDAKFELGEDLEGYLSRQEEIIVKEMSNDAAQRWRAEVRQRLKERLSDETKIETHRMLREAMGATIGGVVQESLSGAFTPARGHESDTDRGRPTGTTYATTSSGFKRSAGPSAEMIDAIERIVDCRVQSRPAIEVTRAMKSSLSRKGRTKFGLLQSCLDSLPFLCGERDDLVPTPDRFVGLAKSFLENQFEEHVLTSRVRRSVLQGDDEDDFCDALSAFVEARRRAHAHESQSADLKLDNWTLLFLALRSGHAELASQIVEKKIRLSHADGPRFAEMFTRWTSSKAGHLLEDLARGIHDLFLTEVAACDNPFRKACYILISGLDMAYDFDLPPNDFAVVVPSVEDYLWFRLSSVQSLQGEGSSSGLPSRLLSLVDLQRDVQEYGAGYFDPDGEDPSTYAFVLLMTGQYSRAIDYLARSSERLGIELLECAAHIAAVLVAYNLLPPRGETPGSSGRDVETYDYPPLLWRYINSFAGHRARDAVLYLFLIRDKCTRLSLLVDLAFHSRQDDVVFGLHDVSSVADCSAIVEVAELAGVDGMSACQEVASQCGIRAEEAGDKERAVLLYQLSGREFADRCLSLAVSKLAREVDSEASISRSRTILFVSQLGQRIDSGIAHAPADARLVRTMQNLLTVANFYDFLWAKNYALAFDCVRRFEFLAPSLDSVTKYCIDLRENGKYTMDLLYKLPSVLYAVANLLCAIFQANAHGDTSGPRDLPETKDLAERAVALVAMAEILKLRGKSLTKCLLELELVVRRSTDPPELDAQGLPMRLES